jgi:uncharacterized protein with HEPN domain
VSRGDAQRLDDIRRMCEVAAQVAARGRSAFDGDELLRLALERALEIAGEAATQLSHAARANYSNVAWRELVAVRVLLAHAYHRADSDQLWSIAVNDLPAVAAALQPRVEDAGD